LIVIFVNDFADKMQFKIKSSISGKCLRSAGKISTLSHDNQQEIGQRRIKNLLYRLAEYRRQEIGPDVSTRISLDD
jgi:hypothetical protein